MNPSASQRSTPPSSKRRGIHRVFQRFVLSAWFGSLLFHLLVLTVLLLWFAFKPATLSGPGEKTAAGSIVLKQESDEGTDFFDSDNNMFGEASPNTGDETITDALSEQALNAAFASMTSPNLEFDAIGVNNKSVNVPSGGGLSQYLGQLGPKSPGLGRDPGGKAKQRLFGVEAEGSSFVYVFDRSASMNEYGGRPMRAAKAVLTQNIDALDDWHLFGVIFYNENQLPWRPGKMEYAREQNRNAAKRFIEGVVPLGGTRHQEPLAMAIQLKPEVIFFLTDGDEQDRLTQNQLQEIERLNGRGANSVIHVIQFGVGQRSGSGYLQTLARQNGGKFVYINIGDM